MCGALFTFKVSATALTSHSVAVASAVEGTATAPELGNQGMSP